MKTRYRYFAGDFETTVFEGQEYTEVWSSCLCELFTDDIKLHHSIDETYQFLKDIPENICIYYHNLKFDGSFWIDFLIRKLKLKQAYEFDSEGNKVFQSDKDMKNNTFKYVISELGQWYFITIKCNGKLIEIRDSAKLLPFSLKSIGESFETSHKKLEMEYKGFRYAGCEITDEEKEYIFNDVYVLKEALEIVYNQGHLALTIGSACLKEYKDTIGKFNYRKLFPNLADKFLPGSSISYDDYIRKSYKGGFCYLDPKKAEKIYHNGLTFDVNSLYPSKMHSMSGDIFPVGDPSYWEGNYIPDNALRPDRYFFIRIKTRFYVKKGYLPFIQIKNSFMYNSREHLRSSDIYVNGKRCKYYESPDGRIHDTRQILTLTQTDYKLFLEHYNVVDFEILDGCYFDGSKGLFDEYIDFYKVRKLKEKGARRQLAKLFLNNLYGKFATSSNSSFKTAYVKDDGVIGFDIQDEHNKKVGYIPIGSAITSYAREHTIRAAQANYYYNKNKGFIYADTDSMHLNNINISEVKGIEIDDKEFNKWALENTWDTGYFLRQKTYIEIENGNYIIKCAGMPENSKKILESWFKEGKIKLTDFKSGLEVPGALKSKRIKGGVVLLEGIYSVK